MKKTNFTTRAYIMKTGQIMLRVRWCNKKNEVNFSVGYCIDPKKWDSNKQLVKNNTPHIIRRRLVYAREINTDIRNFIVCVEEVFAEYDVKSEIPSKEELKQLVNEKMGRLKLEAEVSKKSLYVLFKVFLTT